MLKGLSCITDTFVKQENVLYWFRNVFFIHAGKVCGRCVINEPVYFRNESVLSIQILFLQAGSVEDNEVCNEQF